MASARTLLGAGLAAAAILSTFGAQTAQAAACKDVRMFLENRTGESIKLIDIDYKADKERWRSENTKNRIIDPGATYRNIGRNLEGVGGKVIQVRFEFRRLNKRGGWSGKEAVYTEFGRCADRARFAAVAQ